jgi:hypothetical protein
MGCGGAIPAGQPRRPAPFRGHRAIRSIDDIKEPVGKTPMGTKFLLLDRQWNWPASALSVPAGLLRRPAILSP